MVTKNKMKNTDIGLIPEDWDVKSIRACTDVVTGATPSTKVNEYWGGQIKWMSSGELNNKFIYNVKGRITQEGYDNSGTHMIPPHCVLIGLAGQGKTRGTAAYNYIPLCTNQSIGSILPNNEVFDSSFLYYYIDSQYDNLRLLSAGDGGRGGLNKQIILNLLFPNPELKEQTAIANVLNKIDSLLRDLDKVIYKKRLMKEGAMQQLLTGKVRLEGFNDPWITVSLQDIGHFNKTSIDPQQYPETDFVEYSMPSYDNGRLPERKLGVEMNSNRTIIEGQCLLINKLNVRQQRIWLVNQCEENSVCSSEFLPFKSDTCDLAFIGHVMRSPKTTSDLIDMSTGTSNSQRRVAPKDLKAYSVTIPNSTEEQHEIAKILTTMDNEIQSLEAERYKYISIKQGMMQKLLTGQIRLPQSCLKEE